MNKCCLLLLCMGCLGTAVQAQPDPSLPIRRLCFSELYAELTRDSTTDYVLENAEVYFDKLRDTRFVFANGAWGFRGLRLKQAITFRNVNLPEQFFFEACQFFKPLVVRHCILSNISLDSVELAGGIDFGGNHFNGIYIDKSQINGLLVRNNQKNTMRTWFKLSIRNSNIYVNTTNTWIEGRASDSYVPNSISASFLIFNDGLDTKIIDSKFSSTVDNPTFVVFGYTERTKLKLQDNIFLIPLSLGFIKFTEDVTVTRNKFTYPTSFNQCSMGQDAVFDYDLTQHAQRYPFSIGTSEAAYLPDTLLTAEEKKSYSCFFTHPDSAHFIGASYVVSLYTDKAPAARDSILELDFNIHTRSYLNFYKQVSDNYRRNGFSAEANRTYVCYKNVETKQLAHDYARAPSLAIAFNLSLNRFLAFFCDYGTDPAKALLFAFYVVLGFGMLYVVFPSAPDNLMRRRWQPFFSRSIAYFSSPTRLHELDAETRSKQLENLEQFSTSLVSSQAHSPRVIAWAGMPFYHLALLYYRVQRWLLQRLDVAPKAWSALPVKQRWRTTTVAALLVSGFVLWGITMRLINALALSLNAFITLGYGEIQARGIARYLAVLEGVCGWFLLSIFSVSLITQLMQ